MTFDEAKAWLEAMPIRDWTSFPESQGSTWVTVFLKRIEERYWRLNGWDERGLVDMADEVFRRCVEDWKPCLGIMNTSVKNARRASSPTMPGSGVMDQR